VKFRHGASDGINIGSRGDEDRSNTLFEKNGGIWGSGGGGGGKEGAVSEEGRGLLITAVDNEPSFSATATAANSSSYWKGSERLKRTHLELALRLVMSP